MSLKNSLYVDESQTPAIMITNLESNKKEKLEIIEEIDENSPSTYSLNAGYSFLKSSKGNAALNRATKSLVIGTIATILGVSVVASIAVSLGTYFYGIGAPHVYWSKGTWI